jgi:hypothetical protein
VAVGSERAGEEAAAGLATAGGAAIVPARKETDMSFLKKLFGLGGGGAAAEGTGEPAPSDTEDHNGYTITATPMKEGGQYQVAGTISKTIDGEVKTYKFLRVDRFNERTACVELILQKGRQIIGEQGDKMFR